MTDEEKLKKLAKWLDARDDMAGFTSAREVQDDLRRIAKKLERLSK